MTTISGLSDLWAKTKGDSKIRIVILDGSVDLLHPCFDGATLSYHPAQPSEEVIPDAPMAKHGTHVASIIFGQHKSGIKGIAPGCEGIIIPVFSDTRESLSQLDLARGIELAVESEAHIINVSGGQFSDSGEAEDWLVHAVELCQKNNVLLVAAAGNDGCDCLHVPAALPSVLAVGAMDEQGRPMAFSNWGSAYSAHGILAPGQDIFGAIPGGGIAQDSGTSVAVPMVTGVAALLLSLQLEQGKKPDPGYIQQILLSSAIKCDVNTNNDCWRYLDGQLNISKAIRLLEEESMTENTEVTIKPSACECQGIKKNIADLESLQVEVSSLKSTLEKLQVSSNKEAAVVASTTDAVVTSTVEKKPVVRRVFVLGTLGYDFGSEACRDAYKQLMAPNDYEGELVPANPHDARQMVQHLKNNLSESTSLIWTLNIELTPIYAIEGSGPFARDIYETLVVLLSGQIKGEDDPDYVERICIPGTLSGKTKTLFSGQQVPVIELLSGRGVYGWKVNALIDAAVSAMPDKKVDDSDLRDGLKSFLERVYYSIRNLGTTSQDRALNFAATNAFQATAAFSDALGIGLDLDDIQVEKSPFGRMDSDCWDVHLKFFDPNDNRHSKRVYRFTIDVSETMPVTLGKVRSWSVSN
jgi:cyanobactin maturation PatA/PatG family protease